MTREEAVRVLGNLKLFHDDDNEIYKALNMAIEALKICNDCVWYKERSHGECKTCKNFVRGGLDGKTYVCEHPEIQLDDYYDYACIMMEENDFCSRYVPREGDADD